MKVGSLKVLAFPALLVLLSKEVSADCSAGNAEVGVERRPSSIGPGLYIDTDNPALCTGQLTAWKYCYYEPSSGRRIDVRFKLHNWRLNPITNMYRKVRETIVEFRIKRGRGRFRCATKTLPKRDYIEMERGDLLGTSLGTPTLFLVADAKSTQHLYFTNAATQNIVASNDLRVASTSGKSLHVSADIVGDLLPIITAATPTTATTATTPTTATTATTPTTATTATTPTTATTATTPTTATTATAPTTATTATTPTTATTATAPTTATTVTTPTTDKTATTVTATKATTATTVTTAATTATTATTASITATTATIATTMIATPINATKGTSHTFAATTTTTVSASTLPPFSATSVSRTAATTSTANIPESDSTGLQNELSNTIDANGPSQTTYFDIAGTEGSIERDHNPGLGPEAIAGAAVGLLVLLASVGLVVMVIVLRRKRRLNRKDSDVPMYQIGIDNPSKTLTMEGPQSYELPQPMKSLNGVHAHRSCGSTRQLRCTLDPEGRRGDNWFNDSFENNGDMEDRYATRPHLLSNALSADAAKSAQGSSEEATEENIYDIPDEALANYSGATLNGSKPVLYECAKDTNEEDIYDDIVAVMHEGDSSGANPADIYDDIITNSAVVNLGGLHESDSSNANPVDIYDDIITNSAVMKGHSSNAKPSDIYEFFEEVDTEAVDIYEAVDEKSHDGSQI